MLVGVAERQRLDVDAPAAAVGLRRTLRHQRIRLGRHVHHVAQALDRDVGLLELLPQAHQAQHRLAHAAGEHLERDQHADGKGRGAAGGRSGAVDHQQRPHGQDGERHHLFQRVGDDVVAVGELLGLEARSEILRELVAVARFQHRLHLQGFHRGHAGDVFGHERLVARADQELLVQLQPENRRHREAQRHDQREDGEREQAQLPAIPEHHREEDEQERAVEQQRHRRAGDELADLLHPVQPRHQHAGLALLEIRHGQAEQMPEHGLPQHRVHAVAGVQHQVLAHPGHDRGEQHEHDERDAHHP